MSTPMDIVVAGSGALARIVIEIIEAQNDESPRWSLLGMVDDDPGKAGTEVFGYPVLGTRDWLAGAPRCDVFLAFGKPSARRRFADWSRANHCDRFAAAIHHRELCAQDQNSLPAGLAERPSCRRSLSEAAARIRFP